MSKEWQYHAARGFGKILCHLPYPVIISLGRKLGPFVGKLMAWSAAVKKRNAS